MLELTDPPEAETEPGGNSGRSTISNSLNKSAFLPEPNWKAGRDKAEHTRSDTPIGTGLSNCIYQCSCCRLSHKYSWTMLRDIVQRDPSARPVLRTTSPGQRSNVARSRRSKVLPARMRRVPQNATQTTRAFTEIGTCGNGRLVR